MVADYSCIIYQNYDGSNEEPADCYFLQISNGAQVVRSCYAYTLDELLEPLIEERRTRFNIFSITSPPTRFNRGLGQIQRQIPEEQFFEFLKEYMERTKDMELHLD